MPTVKLVPTGAVITAFEPVGGATIEILGDENVSTYYRVESGADLPSTMNHIEFSTNPLYDSL
jgi:hypothetical protein